LWYVVDNILRSESRSNPKLLGKERIEKGFSIAVEEIEAMEKLPNHSLYEIETVNSKLNQMIAEKEVLVNQLTQVIAERNSIRNQLGQTIAEKDSLRRQLNYTKSLLNGIYASDFWKVASSYYKVRDSLIVLRRIYDFFKWLKRKIKNSPCPEYISKFTLYAKRHILRAEIKEKLKINNIGYSKAVMSATENAAKDATAQIETLAVRSMDVQLNYLCNADCFFCTVKSKDYHPSIDFKAFQSIVSHVHMKTVEELVLTGGEPTVNNGLDQILRFTYEKYPQTKVRLITNAIHLPGNLMESLFLGNVASIHISINASNREDYCRIMGVNKYERVTQNIRAIIKKRTNINSTIPAVLGSLVLVKQNISNIVPFVTMGKDLGLDSVYVLSAGLSPELLDSAVDDQETIKKIFDQAKEASKEKGIPLVLCEGIGKPETCKEPWRKIFVGARGEVNPCCGYDFNISKDHLLRGNLLQQDLKDFWYSGLYDALRKGLSADDPLPGCRACYKQMFSQG